MASIKLTINEKDKTFTITGTLESNPQESKSGKSINHFTTGGAIKPGATIKGQPVSVGLNMYTSNPNYKGRRASGGGGDEE